MASSQAWFESQTAPNSDAMLAGDGCHPDETQALSDYLNGSVSAGETATRITAPILKDSSPPKRLSRLWGLLSDGLVELSTEDRRKILELLPHIGSLPPQSGIEWAEFRGFGSMWDSLNRLHLHGSDSWERSVGSLGREEIDELRQTFVAVGHAEAGMYLRDIVPESWGYEVLNLACSDRLGLEIFVSEIFAWLNIAGGKLKEEMARSEKEVRKFTRPMPNSPTRERMSVEGTMAEHWSSWKEALLRLSQEESGLSEEGRMIAGRCYGLM